jgi:hypothetical protein
MSALIRIETVKTPAGALKTRPARPAIVAIRPMAAGLQLCVVRTPRHLNRGKDLLAYAITYRS